MEDRNSDSVQTDRANSPGHAPCPISDHHRKPSSEESTTKAADILVACGLPADAGTLALLATSRGGFLTDQHRRVACSSVLPSASHRTGPSPDWRYLPRHRDEDQVKLDVNRSFVYYPN
ncbi:MAG: hypothetical protein Q9187_004064, partial [Circinaria calcarea]